jgi:hypothetical protein
MGLFRDLVEGVATGLITASANGHAFPSGQGHAGGSRELVESLCAQLGWSIDGRVGNDGIILNFKDPLIRIRQVVITCGESGRVVGFGVSSAASIAPGNLPPDVPAYLLRRNCGLSLAAWKMFANDRGSVSFGLSYCALTQGLDAATFRFACEAMAKEAHEFDAKLHASGLL